MNGAPRFCWFERRRFARSANNPPYRDKTAKGWATQSCTGVSVWLFVFFFEDEVGGGGAGGDFGLMGDACGDVDDVSGVEDDFFSALDAGAQGFAGGGAVGVFSLHGASGDEGDGALLDDHLVGPELVAFGVSAVDADDEEGAVVAVVVHDVGAEAGWICFCGGEEFGFVLLEVGGGVGGLGEEGWGGDEGEGQDDAAWHSDSLDWLWNESIPQGKPDAKASGYQPDCGGLEGQA
jgi:hypothetical protein